MANLKLRYLIVVILLIVTTTVVSALQYDSSADDTTGFVDLQKIPMQVGNWNGQDLHLDESVYEILETRAIIHRNYTDNLGHTILLSIVYYHDTKVDFHAPEACLGGRGQRTSKKVKDLELYVNNRKFPLEVAEIIATNDNSYGISYYFYKAGSFLGQNYIQMRLNLAKNSILSGDKSGALIRFSGNYLNEDEQQEMEKTMQLLMQEILPAITG